jgi:hypothetical protein
MGGMEWIRVAKNGLTELAKKNGFGTIAYTIGEVAEWSKAPDC